LLQTYDSTFVFVFICIKGNIGGGGAATVQWIYTNIFIKYFCKLTIIIDKFAWITKIKMKGTSNLGRYVWLCVWFSINY
jgi:hypothetical protein